MGVKEETNSRGFSSSVGMTSAFPPWNFVEECQVGDAVESRKLAHVRNCNLARREGLSECRSVSLRANRIDRARECALLADGKRLQSTDWGNFVDRAT